MRPIIPWSRKKALNWGGSKKEDMNTGQNEWLFLPQYLGWLGKSHLHYSLSVLKWGFTPCGGRSALHPCLPGADLSQRLGSAARRSGAGRGRPEGAHREGGSPGLWQRTRAGRCSTGTCEEACAGQATADRLAGLTHRRARSRSDSRVRAAASRASKCCVALRAAPLPPPDGEAAGCLPRLMVTSGPCSSGAWSTSTRALRLHLPAQTFVEHLRGPTQTFRRVAREHPRVLERPLWVPLLREDQGEGGRGPALSRGNVTAVSRGWSLHDAQPSVPSVLAASRARCRDGEGARGGC